MLSSTWGLARDWTCCCQPAACGLAALRDRGIQTVDAEAALTTECDVLAPCATGGIINARSIPGLACLVIAGGANNQLETPADAEALRKREIVYAPDFVINAGGVLHGGGLEEQHWTREVLDARLAGIGDAISEILTRADRDGISTDAAARRIAMGRIEEAEPAGGQGLRARM